MANKLLQLELNDEFIGNYSTDENGEAQLSIDTSDMFVPEFTLKVRYPKEDLDVRNRLKYNVLKILTTF